MRPRAPTARVALTVVIATALTASAAPASAGGTRVPARNGGTAYGSALPPLDKRPVAAALSLSPRTVTAAGSLPRIRVQVRQRGVRRVRARVVVLRLPRGTKVAGIALGWIRTDRRISVLWPHGITLAKGRYLVRLHATDARGNVLRRSARRPGRAVITVHAAPKAAPAPAAAAALSPGGPGVFPVAGPFSFGGTEARFGAQRDGHIHEGQDIIAAAGVPVLAPYAGRISSTSYQAAGAGEYIVVDAVDGRDYFFAHCTRGTTAVTEGAFVARGQPLCLVGSSGIATGPHLHFEIWNVGWRVPGGYPVDPLPELRAWAGR